MIVTTKQVKQIQEKQRINAKDWPKEYVCNFLEAGLVNYADAGAGIAKLTKDTIIKMMPTFVGKPVVINHIDVSPRDFEEHAVGYITRVWWDDYSGWAYCAFLITDDKAKEKIAQGYSVSCAYDVRKTGPGGEWHAIKYDEEITEGFGTHLALVLSPRYEDCRILVNSKQAKITLGEGRKTISVKVNHQQKNQPKEESVMIQLFKKANQKAGAEVDPKDPTKQKWNADAVYVKVENDYVPLEELAKFATKENEYVALPETVENEIDINGVKHNVNDLIENYKKSKAENTKNEKEEEKEEKKDNEKEEEKKEDKENKKNEDEKGDKKEEEETEEQIEKGNKKNEKAEEEDVKKNEKKDVKHFVKLNTAKENGTGAGGQIVIDTRHNRVERGKAAYGSGK